MSISNNLNLISKVSIRRITNLIQLNFSYYLSKITKVSTHYGMPVSIAIEPTTACNLGCPECPSGLKQFTRKEGNLKLDFFKKLIDEQKKSLLYLTFYFQGEPYINPNFLDMVKHASDNHIYTSTSTNAHFITPEIGRKTVESGLDRIIISIDGTTQEVYEQYRKKGQLSKVIEGTKNLIEAKEKLNSNTPHVVFQFLVVKPNEHQMDDVQRLGEELGVDEVKFKSAQVYDYENGNPLIPNNEKYARYKKLPNGKYEQKNKLENHCWRMWSSTVITWDGLVVPCCFDKDATHQLGDLKENSFNDVWNSSQYVSMRKAVLNSRKDIDICKNCSEGAKVWV